MSLSALSGGVGGLAVRAAPIAAPGHYQTVVQVGTMNAGLAAFSDVLQFRWSHATKLAVIRSVRLEVFRAMGTGFAAGLFRFEMYSARAWTVDGTGGTTTTFTGNNSKLRTGGGMPTSSASIRTASTVALGAGTRTGDAGNLAVFGGNVTAAANTVFASQVNLYLPSSFDQPLELANQEGFVIDADVPATGTWQAIWNIAWSERDP